MINLFPTVIHEIDVENFSEVQQPIIDFIYAEREANPTGLNHSNCGGWHSRALYHLDENDNILKRVVLDALNKYLATNVIFKEGVVLRFTALWAMINNKGHYNTSHIHPGSDLAGVFWVKTPENSGNLVFNSPHIYNHHYEMSSYSEVFREKTNAYPSYWFNPFHHEGQIILFPSSLEHYVKENESNEDRISVSFNIDLEPS